MIKNVAATVIIIVRLLRQQWWRQTYDTYGPVNTPITLLAKDVLISVARPRSPIFTEPVGPVIKMLSHFKSRCTMGGVRVWRKCRPFRICLHQLRNTFGFITLKRLRYLKSTQPTEQITHDTLQCPASCLKTICFFNSCETKLKY